MFHPQITEIQPFESEHFSTKTLKFQQYDIIYDISADFEFLLACGIILYWATPVQNFTMIWPLMELIEFFMFLFCVFLDKRQRSQYTDIINFMQFFFIFELTPSWFIPVQKTKPSLIKLRWQSRRGLTSIQFSLCSFVVLTFVSGEFRS